MAPRRPFLSGPRGSKPDGPSAEIELRRGAKEVEKHGRTGRTGRDAGALAKVVEDAATLHASLVSEFDVTGSAVGQERLSSAAMFSSISRELLRLAIDHGIDSEEANRLLDLSARLDARSAANLKLASELAARFAKPKNPDVPWLVDTEGADVEDEDVSEVVEAKRLRVSDEQPLE